MQPSAVFELPADHTLPRRRGVRERPDIVCLSTVDWQPDRQRPAQPMAHLATAGHRVFFVSAAPFAGGGWAYETRHSDDNVTAVRLATAGSFDVEGGRLDDDSTANLLASLAALRRDFDLTHAMAVVYDIASAPLARRARALFGWPLVYQCMNHREGLADRRSALPLEDAGLVHDADLLLLADERLVATGAAANANTALLRDSRVVATIAEGMARAFPTVSIVVVTYDNLEYTRACLRSVLETTAYPGIEVVLVDNASRDGTGDYLRSLAAETGVVILLNDDNRGFARAVNQGLAAARGDRLVVLNNDTLVPDGWLPRLLRHLARPEIGLVVATTSFAGNEAMVPIDYHDRDGLQHFADRRAVAHAGEVLDVRCAAMYCVAMRREVFTRVGPLDERFGVGMFEDDDYSQRVRAAGLRVVCADDAFVHHFGRTAFAQLPAAEYQALWDRNLALFEEKWGEAWQPHRQRGQ
jgi:GT2 family glycosyltransferase